MPEAVDGENSRAARPGGRTRSGHYEYRVLTFPPAVSRGETRQVLTDEAEYGHWELARSAVYVGGARKVWLRRRVMRVTSTLAGVPARSSSG